jgi:hypothetical protein
MKRPRGFWGSEDGRVEIERLFASTQWKCIEPWGPHIVDSTRHQKKISFQCNVCRETHAVTIRNAVTSLTIGCSCRRARDWKTLDGFNRFVDLLQKHKKQCSSAVSYEVWIASNPNSDTTIELLCVDCNHVATPTIECFRISKHGGRCSCNLAPYSSEAGRQVLLKLIEGTKYKSLPILDDPQEWLKFRANHRTPMPVCCTKCGVVNTTTEIMQFKKGGHILCRCTKFKTQSWFLGYVEAFVEASWPGLYVVYTERGIPGSHRMRFDVLIKRNGMATPETVIELDGRQHFQYPNGFHRTIDEFKAQVERDLCKEKLAIDQDISVLRLFQPDVTTKAFDWRPALKELLLSPFPQVVALSTTAVYEAGAYYDKRHGSS